MRNAAQLSAVNQLTDLTSFIDDDIKDKINSNDYLKIMTKLNDLYKSIKSTGNNTNVRYTLSDEDYQNITFRWNSIVYNYMSKYKFNRLKFLRSKFNVRSHINLNEIVNCSCTNNLTSRNCEGNIINCKYLQNLIIKLPLTLIPLFINKYPLDTLCDEFNKFYRLRESPKLNRETCLDYTKRNNRLHDCYNNRIKAFVLTYGALIKLNNDYQISSTNSNESKYLVGNIINLIIMSFIGDNYYLIKIDNNLVHMIKKCKEHLDNYFYYKTENDIFEIFLNKINMNIKILKKYKKKFSRLTNKYFYD